jgi:hypothetical protein
MSMTATGIGRADDEGGKLDGSARGRNRGALADGIPVVSADADAAAATARAEADEHRRGMDPLLRVRASDLEPYTGLGYLSKLFRVIAVLLLGLLVAEVIAGAASDDPDKWRTLLSEASRLVVVAGVLWGAGDLATLLIDVGHDVRATRILLGRQVAHHAHEFGEPLARPAGERATTAPVLASAGLSEVARSDA